LNPTVRHIAVRTLVAAVILVVGAGSAFGQALEEIVGGDCFACHGARGLQKELPTGQIVSLYVEKRRFDQSPHGPLGCRACHGDKPHPGRLHTAAAWQAFVYSLAQACQRCHPEPWSQFRRSVHVVSGNPSAPNRCTRCHDPHEAGRLPGSKRARVAMCGRCHAAEAQTYFQTIHGQALELGDTRVAACTDCHKAHDVCGISQPPPCLTPRRVAAICSRCHGKVATRQVVGWFSHRPRTRAEGIILHLARIFYIVMIPLILAAMIVHNALAQTRRLPRARS